MIKIIEFEKNLTPHDIKKVEKKLNIQFPEEYKCFLLLYNGGHPQPDGFTYICDDHQHESSVAWFPAGVLAGLHRQPRGMGVTESPRRAGY